jgi:PAS domain S-box-containing protein
VVDTLGPSYPATQDASFEASVLDQVDAAVIATDRSGLVTRWNRHAEKVFGWTGEEANGRSVLDLVVSPSDQPAIDEIMDQVLAGSVWEGEMELRRKDGSRVVCHVNDAPIHDGVGAVVGVVSVSVDVTEAKESERRLAARTSVTRALAEADTLAGAASNLLQGVCGNLGWPLGSLWAVAPEGDVIRCVDVWYDPSLDAAEFEAFTRAVAFEPGVGLPGRVWASGRPAWIPDVVQDRNFPRGAIAAIVGLHGAFGFPIVLGDEVLGIIEFFSGEVKEPDEDLLAMMAVIGSQIGQFMERKEAEEELRRSRDQLQAIFQSVAEGITVQDPTGRLIYANDAAARQTGFATVEEFLAAPLSGIMQRFELTDESGAPFSFERLPGRQALRGETPEDVVVRFRDPETGEERWTQLRATPVFDTSGKVQFAVNIFHDVSDRKRRDEAQRFLAEAGPILSAAATDLDATLARVAELAVPWLADWCAIEMVQDDGTLRTLKVAHVDPDKLALAEDWGRRYPPDPSSPRGAANVVRTGRSEIYEDIPDALLVQAAVDEEHLEILRGLQLRSVITVPLTARGRVFGVMTLVFAESGRRYGPADLALAEDLARRAALAVDNARIYQERDHIARTLQRSLLPPRLPDIPGMEIAGRYRAAGAGNDVGGDFYDAFEAADGSWVVVIGDVCGKGPEAAAVTGLARHTIRAAAMRERKPSEILTTLNDAVLQQRSDHMFCTVAYVRVRPNPGGARLTICCGGHPLPLVLRADGTVIAAGSPGTLLGIFPDPELVDRTVDLGPGDALVLFTDGVIEEHGDGEMFGRDGMTDLLRESVGRKAEEIAEAIEQAVVAFGPAAPRDDIAIVVLRVET